MSNCYALQVVGGPSVTLRALSYQAYVWHFFVMVCPLVVSLVVPTLRQATPPQWATGN